MEVSSRICLLLLLTIGVSCVLGRPGAASYPSEDENVIPDYAYDNEEDKDNAKSELIGRWKSVPVARPDELYDEEVPETTGFVIDADSTWSTSSTAAPEEQAADVSTPEEKSTDISIAEVATPEEKAADVSTPVAANPEERAAEVSTLEAATPEAATPEEKAAEVASAVRAVEIAGSAGAAAAVRAVEVVKAAFENTEVPDVTTTTTRTYAVESGRSLGSGSPKVQPMGDAPAPTVDQSLYGFSKFLHDLLQVPVQMMRSVSSYLSGAFNSRHDVTSYPITPQNDHGLTSAMLSQSF